MLGLKMATDPRWVNLVDKSIEEILTDHAYCEQKAASTGISLIVKYPTYEKLVEEVTLVVEEEWGHFAMVLDELKKRGLKLGHQRKDEYVVRLQEAIKHDGTNEGKFLDSVLKSAMIEARSCERFKLLSQECADLELRKFYKKLMISEAGHYKLFIDLANLYVDREKVKKRWNEFLDIEAEVMRSLEIRGDRMH